jgi:hypothetical protein
LFPRAIQGAIGSPGADLVLVADALAG